MGISNRILYQKQHNLPLHIDSSDGGGRVYEFGFFATRNQCKNRVERKMNKDFGFLFFSFSTKWQKNMKRKTNVQFEFNPHFIHAAAYKRNYRNFRKLTCSITIIRDLWKITQIGSIGFGIYFLPIYQLRLINLLRIHNLYPIFCGMNV